MKQVFQISASIPTHHKFGALSALYLDSSRKYNDGSYTATRNFDTEKDAKTHLKERANAFYWQGDMSEAECDYELQQIEEIGCLEYDGVTARIATIKIATDDAGRFTKSFKNKIKQ